MSARQWQRASLSLEHEWAEHLNPTNAPVSDEVAVAAIPRLYPGSTLLAKHMPGGDVREVAIDWAPALAQVADTHA
jgi:hypothetical protein